MRRLLLAAIAILSLASPAAAQNAITQEGTVLQNAPIMFRGNNRARQGAPVGGAPTGQIITTGDATVGGRCDYSAPTDAAGGYHFLCIDAATGRIRLGGTKTPPPELVFDINGSLFPFPWTAGGNVVGPTPTIVNKLACWKNTAGSLLGECDAANIVPQRLLLSNSLTGDQGGNLVGGVELRTNSHTAQSLTDIGKINGLYVETTFGTPGAAAEGQRAAIFGKVTQNGPTAWTSANYQYNTGLWSWVLVNQGNTTIGQEPNYHGFGGLVELGGTNTRAGNVFGIEVDVGFGASVVAGNRIGIMPSIGAGTFGAAVRAQFFDGAYAIGRANAGDASWKQGYMLRAPTGVWPFASDSVLMGGLGPGNGAGGVAAVAATGIDLRGIVFGFQEYISDHFRIDANGSVFSFGEKPFVNMKDTTVPVTAGGLTRWVSFGDGTWAQQINTAAGGDFTTGINAFVMSPIGEIGFGAGIKPAASTVAALPTCAPANQGSVRMVTDATAPTYNAALVGGGAIRVPAFCNGTGWTAH